MSHSNQDPKKDIQITGLAGGLEGTTIHDLEQLHAEIERFNRAQNVTQRQLDEMRERVRSDDENILPKDYNDAARAFKDAVNKAINYRAMIPRLGIGFAELQGIRETQEDRVIASALPTFNELSEEQRELVLLNTPRILHKVVVQDGIGIDKGATLCAAIVVGNKVYSLNLGDSTLFTCKIGANNIEVKQLNEVIHLKKKIKDKSSVKESLGDVIYEDGDNGVVHEPKLKVETLSLQNGERGLVIVGCDGLTESVLRASREIKDPNIEQMSEQWIQKHLQAIQKYAPDEISAALANQSLDESTEDNISCMTIAIDPNETIAKYAAVFDGHSGDEVAEAAAKLFDLVLNNQILLVKLKDISSTLSDSIQEMIVSTQTKKSVAEVVESFEKYNAYLTNLILNAAELTENKINVIVDAAKQVNKMSQQGSGPITVVEEYRDEYFPLDEPRPAFLDIPIQVAKNTLQQHIIKTEDAFLGGADGTSLRSKDIGVYAVDSDAEKYYHVAKIIFDIRAKYNPRMPPISDQVNFVQFRDENKGFIQSLEQSVKSVFLLYPEKSVSDILNDLKEVLAIKKSQGKPKSIFDMFSKKPEADPFETALTNAINEISPIVEKRAKFRNE